MKCICSNIAVFHFFYIQMTLIFFPLSNIMMITKKEGIDMPDQEISSLKDCFVRTLAPLRVYLFGSYASGVPNEDSDFDFYIVVEDDRSDTLDLMVKAYAACSEIKKRPVDIIVGTKSSFDARKQRPTIENEVFHKGVLLYGA